MQTKYVKKKKYEWKETVRGGKIKNNQKLKCKHNEKI